jgi:methionine--tRNA ligase beta chain
MSTPASSGTPAPAPAASSPIPPAPGQPKPQIAFEDFAKVDLRVAKIVHAENHPSADKLFKLQLDDGSGTPRQICAGIRGAYTAEQLVGRSIIIVANLAPRMLRGEESRGMLLAASDAPKDAGAVRRVVLLTPEADIPPGSTVS